MADNAIGAICCLGSAIAVLLLTLTYAILSIRSQSYGRKQK